MKYEAKLITRENQIEELKEHLEVQQAYLYSEY